MSPKLLRIAAIKSLKKMSCEIIPKDELIDFFTDQVEFFSSKI